MEHYNEGPIQSSKSSTSNYIFMLSNPANLNVTNITETLEFVKNFDPINVGLNVLTSIYNNIFSVKVKRFSDKKTALNRTYRMLLEHKEQVNAAEISITLKRKNESVKIENVPKKSVKLSITKTEILRQMFSKKSFWSETELLKATKFDRKNLRVTLAILRNSLRTRETLNIFWSKDGFYELVK